MSKSITSFQKNKLPPKNIHIAKPHKPSIDNLKIPNLISLYNSALSSLNCVKDKKIANKNAIADRQEIYESLKPKTTRIINQLDILGLNKTTIDQAKSLNRLIQGSKKTSNHNQEDEFETTTTKSTSRQSYTQTGGEFIQVITINNNNRSLQSKYRGFKARKSHYLSNFFSKRYPSSQPNKSRTKYSPNST